MINASALTMNDFVGLSSDTGLAIAGEDHLRQSLRDILTTPVGSRVMRRDYGSRLADLIDAPMNPGRVADIVAAAAEAIAKWEPRVTLKRVEVLTFAAGELGIDVLVELRGQILRLERVL